MTDLKPLISHILMLLVSISLAQARGNSFSFTIKNSYISTHDKFRFADKIHQYDSLPKAKKDTEFDKGSKIEIRNLTKSQNRDLAQLARVWGFLKYHHPAIAAGNYNWDYELFRFLPKYMIAESTEKKQMLLVTWIDSLGSFKQKTKDNTVSRKVAVEPDLRWIRSGDFEPTLISRLIKIKDAERPSVHFYIGSASESENPEFKNENAYPEMSYPDTGFRLLALFRHWNMIQYFFPYKPLIDGNWDDILEEFIPVFVQASNEIEYKLAALKMITRVNDTHASMYGGPALEKYFGDRNAPLEITFIDNKPVITGYYDKNLGEKSGLKKGDILEKINGRTVDKIIKELLPISPGSNYSTQLRQITGKLLRTNDTLINVRYKRGQTSANVTLATYDQSALRIPRRSQRADTCFRMIRPDISYLYPGSIKNSYLPQLTPLILKSKGLIIDLRSYPSDFLVYTLANTLLPSPKNFAMFSVPKVSEPGLFEFSDPVRTGEENPEYYKGQVVILINELTQSSAEYTTMAFRTAPRVKVVGSTTAGADGDTSPIYLPGEIITYISGLGVYYPDGKQTQRIGILPDIEVRPTIQGIVENRDELMEKAIEIIDQK